MNFYNWIRPQSRENFGQVIIGSFIKSNKLDNFVIKRNFDYHLRNNFGWKIVKQHFQILRIGMNQRVSYNFIFLLTEGAQFSRFSVKTSRFACQVSKMHSCPIIQVCYCWQFWIFPLNIFGSVQSWTLHRSSLFIHKIDFLIWLYS